MCHNAFTRMERFKSFSTLCQEGSPVQDTKVINMRTISTDNMYPAVNKSKKVPWAIFF